MLLSSLEANFVHQRTSNWRDQLRWELMRLRARSAMSIADDVVLIARKSGRYRQSRCLVSDLHVSGLGRQKCQGNAGRQHDKVVDSSLLWARAIDLCNAWIRAAE
jgi:hypothetical protein